MLIRTQALPIGTNVRMSAMVLWVSSSLCWRPLMLIARRFLFVLAAVLFVFPGLVALGQAYTSIVVFGDSLCDTGNDAMLSAAKNTINGQVPGPASDYTV